MDASDCFQKNVERWSKFSPQASEQVANLVCSHTTLSTNPNGEKNLTLEVDGKKIFVHSEENALAEAKQWFDSLDLRKSQVVYIYGIGLGYAYEALQSWLRQNDIFTIIFIEDNLEIIHRFLETDLATRFLHDKQVWLEYLDWNKDIEPFFESITLSYCLFDFRYYSSPYNAVHYENRSNQIHSKLSFWMMIHRGVEGEHFTHGQMFFTNFYTNILDLPEAYRADNLYGKFHGIPAIVCGAGPSLDKNLALLETLGDRALIFAGATALNAVNSHGFVPHFGVGIDPNPAQATRLIANKAYDIPFLYRNRMSYEALKILHGDKIYVAGSSGYLITNWFEKELNIEGYAVNEGCNVVNFNLAIAREMGCNPIILVGVDLAYSEKRSYQSGVTSHPTHSLKSDFTTKHLSEELVIQNDIHGNQVYTLWKWVAESTWYSQFAKISPDLLIINATEGGIGMPGIPNKPLHEVVHYLLERRFDFLVYQHGEIQNASMPSTVSIEKIEKLIHQVEASVKKCKEYIQKIKTETTYRRNALMQGAIPPDTSLEELDAWKDLTKEIGYEYILKSYNDAFNDLAKRKMLQIENDISIDPRTNLVKKLSIYEQRYNFLLETASTHEMIIKKVLAEHEKGKNSANQTRDTHTELSGYNGNEKYAIAKDEFTLLDPEMGISFVEKYSAEPASYGTGKDIIRYSSGEIKMEQFYWEGKLHGPVTYYSNDGLILARNWYVHGTLQGKGLFFYSSGKLHSVRRFKNGLCDGLQEYYYQNGKIKSSVGYANGKLNGGVRLYYANGKPKRELHFDNGKRTGMERMWNPAGQLTIEVEYFEDLPKNKAKSWHDNGQLAHEIEYNDKGKAIKAHRWDSNGVLISDSIDAPPDYFDQVAIQANLLTESLDNVEDQLHSIARLLETSSAMSGSVHSQMKKDFESLKILMAQLHSINKDLLFESGVQGDNPEEAIWKTPTIQREMQKKLEIMTEGLSKEVKRMQDVVHEVVERERKKNNEQERR